MARVYKPAKRCRPGQRRCCRQIRCSAADELQVQPLGHLNGLAMRTPPAVVCLNGTSINNNSGMRLLLLCSIGPNSTKSPLENSKSPKKNCNCFFFQLDTSYIALSLLNPTIYVLHMGIPLGGFVTGLETLSDAGAWLWGSSSRRFWSLAATKRG
jgi:hypothetical protein